MNLNIRKLKLASLLYVTVPIFVFLFSWVKILIAVPVSALLIYAIWQYYEELKKSSSDKIHFNKYHFLGIVVLCLFWVSLSGIGGFGVLLHDNYKLYAIIKDVMEKSWPVQYAYEGENYYLSAYLAYYITPPVLMGWLSYKAVNIFFFLFSTFGVLLGLIWFAILSKNRLIFGTLFFVLIGGFDISGFLFQKGFQEGLNEIFNSGFIQFYWWNSLDVSKYLLYHGNTNVLFWAPAHAIPCWVVSGVFFYDFLVEKDLSLSPIYLFPLTFWSPFILIGLFPYFLYLLFKNGILSFLKLQNFLIIPPFLLLIWFVTSVSVQDLDSGFAFMPLSTLKAFLKTGFHLFWFVFFEVVIWLIFVGVFISRLDWKEYRTSLYILALVLITIPLYKLGKYNDWVQRVSLPSLFLLWIFVLRAFDNIKNKVVWGAAILLLLFSSADSVSYLNMSSRTSGLTFDYHPLPYEKIKTLPEISVENGWPIEQYMVKGKPSFFKYIAKESSLK